MSLLKLVWSPHAQLRWLTVTSMTGCQCFSASGLFVGVHCCVFAIHSNSWTRYTWYLFAFYLCWTTILMTVQIIGASMVTSICSLAHIYIHVYKTIYRELIYFWDLWVIQCMLNCILLPLFPGTTASLEQNAYVFLESATDAAVCVTVANATERNITLSLSTVDGTAFGNDLYTCCLSDS